MTHLGARIRETVGWGVVWEDVRAEPGDSLPYLVLEGPVLSYAAPPTPGGLLFSRRPKLQSRSYEGPKGLPGPAPSWPLCPSPHVRGGMGLGNPQCPRQL